MSWGFPWEWGQAEDDWWCSDRARGPSRWGEGLAEERRRQRLTIKDASAPTPSHWQHTLIYSLGGAGGTRGYFSYDLAKLG